MHLEGESRKTRMVINSIFVCHFIENLCTVVLGVEKNLMRSLSAYYFIFFFFGDKNKIAFKSSLDLYFHLLIEFIWFDYYSEFKKRYTLRMLVIYLETLGKNVPRRDWEGISRKLWSLVKLYQRNCIWNLDQNLIITLLIWLFALCYSKSYIPF